MSPRERRDAYRAIAGVCGLLVLGLLFMLLASSGCGAATGADQVEARIVEDVDHSADCAGVQPVAGPPLRIMPAGDSITCGTDDTGGYRGPLFAALGARAESVGPRNSASICGGPGFHAGYPGSHTTGYAGYLPGYLAAAHPDVLLLMLGTNGDGGGVEYVRDLVRPALDSSPTLRVLVGGIPATPIQGDYPHGFNVSLSAALAGVPEFGTRLWFVPETETAAKADQYGEDDFHPATPGYAGIADAWMVGLRRAGVVP